MIRALLAAAVAAAVGLTAFDAGAALKKPVSAADNPTIAFNPQPADGDIVLPMPNGLSMVMRAVSIPASNALGDRRFQMGLIALGEGRDFYEKRVDAYISSPVSYKDLPKDWQKQLPADEKSGFFFYFIGKYEITNAQWQAVMGGADSGERGELPKTNISWYDLQEFLCKYNQWLLSEHGDRLPKIEGVPLFLRLPTETEWEYAARGGNLPPEIMNENDFYKSDEHEVEDYAIFGSEYDKPRPVGSKLPNNLGIYDMGGNVAEFVEDGFRYTVVESVKGGGQKRRLHGSEGGFIAKGGSFLSTAREDVYPGKRTEMRMFDKGEDGTYHPHAARSLGARLVCSAINIPGPKKTDDLVGALAQMQGATAADESKPQEAAPVSTEAPKPGAAPAESPSAAPGKTAKPKDRLVTVDLSGDLMAELQKIRDAASSPFMKSNLDQYMELVRDRNAAMARQEDENLTESIRSTIYKIELIRNLADRYWRLKYDLDKNFKELKGKITDENKREADKMLKERLKALVTTTASYRQEVKDLSEFPKEKIDERVLQLSKEYAGDDIISKSLKVNLKSLSTHIEVVRGKGYEKIDNMQVWKTVLGAKMFKVIEEAVKQSGGKGGARK